MLQNASFEDGWRDEGNCQVPHGWQLDAPPGEYTATGPEGEEYYTELPEMSMVVCEFLPDHEQDLFCVDGEYTVKLFGGQKAIHAFFYQEVSGLPVGDTYRFTVPCFVDTYIWDKENKRKLPPNPNGAPTERAARLRLYAVGAGVRQESEWFDEQSVEDFHLNKHRFTWTFDGLAPTMTVGLEVWNPWPVSNCGWFFDGLRLERKAYAECVPPREQYERTYILLPQSYREQPEWAQAAAIATAERGRTVGYSADDAGVGPMDRTVVAVNDELEHAAGELEDFFIEHYPGIDYQSVDAVTPQELGIELLPELTDDIAQGQSWVDDQFGEDPSSIATYGCFVTGLAIVLRKVYGRDATIGVLDDLLVMARVAYMHGNLLDWVPTVGLFPRLDNAIKDNTQYTGAELRAMKRDGYEIILRRSDGKHFVYLEDVDEYGRLHIIDTYDGERKEKNASDYEGIRAARVVGAEPSAPEPQGPRILFGAQEQRVGDKRDEFIARVKPPAWMFLQGYEGARRVKELSPDTLTIIRYVDNDWKSYLYADDLDAAAERFIGKFRDSLESNAEWIDYVTGLNEYIASNDYEALRASGPWMEAFCGALERMGYPARPIGFNAGVGNPQHNYICDEQGIERQIPLMVRGAKALAAAGGAFGHHAYHGSRSDGFCTLTTKDSDGRWNAFHYSMRSLLSIDPVLVEHGVIIDHFLTELGAIYFDPAHGMCNAGAGWRWPDTMGEGAAERYVDELVLLNGFFRDWNAEHGGRLKAALLFIFGGNPDWQYFDIEGEFSVKLADVLEGLA